MLPNPNCFPSYSKYCGGQCKLVEAWTTTTYLALDVVKVAFHDAIVFLGYLYFENARLVMGSIRGGEGEGIWFPECPQQIKRD